MKITVIGSTSRTGLHVLKQGIRRGHDLVAFTRRPQSLENIKGLKRVVTGDALQLSDVKDAIYQQDAVIAIVGSDRIRGEITVRTDISRILLQAMQETNVSRIIWVSSYLLEKAVPSKLVTSFFRWMLRKPLADGLSADKNLMSSSMDWTIVRPSQLLDQKATGKTRLLPEGQAFKEAPFQLNREDLATVLLDLAVKEERIQSVVNVAGGNVNDTNRI